MESIETADTTLSGVSLDSHLQAFMTSLHKLQENEVMTDVTLILPDQSAIPCHKVVLMAASPFFETMFQSGLKEGAEQDIKLDFADADTIKTLVKFFYTGFINVTADNVKALVAASEFLCCKHLKAHCDEYLANSVECSNCIDLYKVGKVFHLGVLLVAAFQFILSNFKGFLEISDFETLTEDELVEFVSNDGLNAENEDIVFEAVVHWVNADQDVRKEAFPKIASLIRFPFCTPAGITSVVCCNALMLNSGCMELALEALRSPYHCNCHHSIHNGRCVPRHAFKGKKQRLIRMVSSDSWKKTSFYCTERIDEDNVEWENMFPNAGGALVKYVVSSPNGIYWVAKNNQCSFLEAESKRVTTIGLNSTKNDSNFTFFNEKIFAFGGSKPGTKPLKSVESFNVKEANPGGKPEQEMLHALKKPYVAQFANKLLVFGGQTEDEPSRVSQEFDPALNKWRLRSEMPGPCQHGAAVALNDKIYVVGGTERVCYSYDPLKDEWKTLSQPTHVYDDNHTTATVWNGNILLGNAKHVEEYDPVNDSWSDQNHLVPQGANRIFLYALWF